MSIIRVIKQQGRFLVANVEVFEDESLSFGARGLMAYLLTKPDHWQVRRDQLVNASPGGRVKLQRMINELKTAGYMRRYQENDPETGKFITITDVFEQRSLNPDSETTISGGPTDTVTTKPDHGDTVSRFPVDGKPVHIVNPDPVNTYNGNFKHRELDPDSLPPGAYVPPDPERIRTMISVLSGTCKGFANFLKGEKCQFYQTAIKLLENGYTEENVMLFRDWWNSNSYYEGQPSLTTLEQEIENAVKGVQKKRGKSNELTQAIRELDQFVNRKIGAKELGPHTIAAIRAVGEGTIRKIGPNNRKSILRHFEDEFEKSRNSQ